MFVLKNAMIFDDNFDLVRRDIAVEGDRIARVAPSLSGGEELDLSGCTILPGFVDVHIHACVDHDTCDASYQGLEKMAAHLVTNGVTTFCPTTMTISKEGIAAALATVRKAIDNRPFGAAVAGANMEGPFISIHKKGAQAGEHVKNPDYNEFLELYNGCGGAVKLVDIAPECDGAQEFIEKAKGLVTVSIAHTSADYDQAMRGFDWGITHATHMYNAMAGLSHRDPGVVGAIMDSSVTAELICDGFHIHPAVLRLTFRQLGGDRICIVSDSMRAAGMPDGVSELGGQTVYVKNGQARLKDGTIAGSTTNMHQEVKNLIEWGVPVREVVKAATITPARVIHEEKEIGSIQEGKRADLVVLDSKLAIRMVIARGEPAVKNL